MYFKRNEIKEVRKHVIGRADSLNLVIGAKDSARFNQLIENILTRKKYYEGENIDPKHMGAITNEINNLIKNLSNYLVRSAKRFKKVGDVPKPVDYLSTAVDALYIVAMEKLGCPNMPVIHSDKGIKKTLEESALKVSGCFEAFNVSKESILEHQRESDAEAVSKEFGLLFDGIKNGKKAESLGNMIAMYQAFKERQKNQNVFLRLFQRAENRERIALIEKMEKMIRSQLPHGMRDIDFRVVAPAEISRNVADALIREEVALAGSARHDSGALLELYGTVPTEAHISDQEKILNGASQKLSLNLDEKFLQDVLGTDNVKSEQLPKDRVVINPTLVKD